MRSIFGKCIAIAMMAAIALVWHSPPVQADEHIGDVRDARTSARGHARAATNAVDRAETAAEAAEEAAVATEEAEEAAKTAADRTHTAEASLEDEEAAQDAADDAADAANDARERAGFKQKTYGDHKDVTGSAPGATNAWGQYKTALAEAGSETYIKPRYTDEDTAPHVLKSGHNIKNSKSELVKAGDTIHVYTEKDSGKTETEANTTGKEDAWSNYRETQWLLVNPAKGDNAQKAVVDAEAAEDAAKKAAEAADKAAENAEEHQRYAESRAMVAKRHAMEATAIAQEATAAAVIKAQAAYDADDKYSNYTALEDAKDAAEDAKEAAEKYADAGEPTDPTDPVDPTDPMAMTPSVSANGVGNLLKFGSWTTLNDRDTLLAVTNPGNAQAMVTVTIKDGMGMMVETFTICLTAGDVWTAALMAADDMQSSTMIIADTGMCDGMSATPPTDMLPLNANYGFIEAYTDMGGMLTGIANVVDAMGGYSSISNAVSLVNFDSASETKMADVRAALAMEGDIRKDMLIGRWSATPSNGAMTHVVLTFPAGGGPGTEPVRIHVYDQSGVNGNRTFMLGAAVNLCTFMTMDGLTTLSCNGGASLPLSSDQGWFKIMSPDMMMGFPVIGTVSTVYDGSNGMFDQTAPIRWMEDMDATADTAN